MTPPMTDEPNTPPPMPPPPMPTPTTPPMAPLPLGDPRELARALVDVESVSGDERAIADLVWDAVGRWPRLEAIRDGDTIAVRTDLGRPERVILAGHLDTVPVAGNLPARIADGHLIGRGSVDMKSGLAVQLALAAEVAAGAWRPVRDVTWIWYDHEEVDYDLSGLGRFIVHHPDWCRADLAVLGEPTSARVEGGCNGTLRAVIDVRGVAAHSARAWLGHNAIHDTARALAALSDYVPGEIEVDGLTYRESLNVVLISGGTAANVIPDRCTLTVNYRFAPDKSVEQATAHLADVLAGYDLEIVDVGAAARPGLSAPLAADLVARSRRLTGREPAAKEGWTDVARFAELGIAGVNLGPGDPGLAHKDDERCPLTDIDDVAGLLRSWLAGD